MSYTHIPVLLEEVLTQLNLQSTGRYVDGTAGAGGHTAAMLERMGPSGQVLAIDRDPMTTAELSKQRAQFIDRLHLVTASYAKLGELLNQLSWPQVDGILLDLGLSSKQLDNPDRGFSFQHDGPLDLRFDQTVGQSAAELLARLPARQLADLLYEQGGVRASHRLAAKIRTAADADSLHTTFDLRRALGPQHPRVYAQVFQALRITVNDELGELARALPVLWENLVPGGRLAIITFHSGEDRIVKQYFRSLVGDHLGQLTTKKPIQASLEEQKLNPRSRSAKLRVIEKLS